MEIIYNLAKYAKKNTLKNFIDSGFNKDQAEILYNIIKVKNLKHNKQILQKDLQNMKYELSLLKEEIIKLELKIVIKLGSIIAVCISLLGVILQLK